MATTFTLKRKIFGIGNIATFGGLKNFQAMSKTASFRENAKNLGLGIAKTGAAVGTATLGAAALGAKKVDDAANGI